MENIVLPGNYDYVGGYLTDKCHLACDYCITDHHRSGFGKYTYSCLTPDRWVSALNRLVLPQDVPITLQGGEPFLYKGIWEILDNLNQKADILTALPSFIKKEDFLNLKTLEWNKREAPYPTIRVSYHKGQNDYKELIHRIAELKDILSIGLFYLEHPAYPEEEITGIKEYAQAYGVELRKKEFLGTWQGKQWGNLLYKDAACGKRVGKLVKCKNTVVPIAPDGTIFRCHSDLYFNRKNLALGSILDGDFQFPTRHLDCDNYGLCNECDVKIKNNHYQVFGYTSVDIRFSDSVKDYSLRCDNAAQEEKQMEKQGSQ